MPPQMQVGCFVGIAFANKEECPRCKTILGLLEEIVPELITGNSRYKEGVSWGLDMPHHHVYTPKRELRTIRAFVVQATDWVENHRYTPINTILKRKL